MQQKTPVIRQWSWRLALPQLAVQVILIIVSILIFWKQYQVLSISFAMFVYLIYSCG